MQEKSYDELNSRASELFENQVETLTGKLEAKKSVTTILEAMRSEEKILMLTEEEERMLRAFRAFKLHCKPGAVWKWQTRPDENTPIIATDTGLVRDPQEVA